MEKKLRWKGVLFVLPSFLGLMIFYILPFIMSMDVGFQSFQELFQNEAFRLATYNTVRIIGSALVLLCLLSLGIALMLESQLEKYRWGQSVLLIPLAIPAASMILLWQDLLGPNGILNSILKIDIDWLNSRAAPYVIIGMILWKNTGYNVLLLLGALFTMPKEYEEAAQLDGASKLRIAWSIKLPYLLPILFFIGVISLQNSFKIFREIYLLQGDYPYGELYFLQHFMNNNFAKLNIEVLSAAAFTVYVFIFLAIYILSYGQQYYLKKSN